MLSTRFRVGHGLGALPAIAGDDVRGRRARGGGGGDDDGGDGGDDGGERQQSDAGGSRRVAESAGSQTRPRWRVTR